MTEPRKKIPKFRRKKGVSTKKEAVIEPTRTSIYDIVVKNFKLANRVIFIHRLIYIGNHTFESEDTLVQLMNRNIRQTNTGYCTENLTGILLYYEHHFCHILEASEEVFIKHCDLLFKCKEISFLQNIKVLSVIHHIKKRFLDGWIFYQGHPPIRVEEIDPNSDLENSMRYIKDCGDKLYKFGSDYLNDLSKFESEKDELNSSTSGASVDRRATNLSSYLSSKTRQVTTGSLISTDLRRMDYYATSLPEVKLLDFLLGCKYLTKLEEYYLSYGTIMQPVDFYLKAWPTASAMVPYNIFDKPFDPIEDLPTQTDKKADDDTFDVVSQNESIPAN